MRKLYYGGPILTMESPIYAESVLTEAGKILAVGNKSDFLGSSDVEPVDLQGRTMMPAFLVPHGHLISVARSLCRVDLRGVSGIRTIQEKIRRYLEKNPHISCLAGFGYDENELFEHRHPTQWELDQASGEIPVIISHLSGDKGVINSSALRFLREKSDVPVGKFGERIAQISQGYVEGDLYAWVKERLPKPGQAYIADKIHEAVEAHMGYALLQEGKGTEEEWNILCSLAERRKIKRDVVCYMDIKYAPLLEQELLRYKEYRGHLRLAGYKLCLDGSLQNKNAWLTQAYNEEPKNCGTYLYEDEELLLLIELAVRQRAQILVHASGDKAVDQLLRVCEKIGPDIRRIRPVLLHGQVLRKDQLACLASFGITPSMQATQIYEWGDILMGNLGIERAAHICPCGSAEREKVPFTLHGDSQVAVPNPMEILWCACARQTRNGILIGEEELISFLSALRGLTTRSAYQYT